MTNALVVTGGCKSAFINIFNPDFPTAFTLWSQSHLTAMLGIALLWFIVPILARKKRSASLDRAVRWSLAFLLLGQYLTWLIYELATGTFSLALSLPLNLCDMSNIFCAVLLLRPNFRLYEIFYFWALGGTIQSYITPNLKLAFPHLEFIVFYIQHGGEILTIVYLTAVTGFRPRPMSIIKSISILIGFVVLVYIFNWAAGTNYMFLMADSPNPSTITKMIQVFGQPPRHLVGLLLVTCATYTVLYLPFGIKDLIVKIRKG